MNSAFEEISVSELAQRLAQQDETVQLIDVREPQELELAALPEFVNLPLSQHETWSQQIVPQLDPHAETVVMCHHGMRSAQMCQWLVGQGFTQVKNVAGGIDAYSTRVDGTVPRY
ncbi:MAG: rhodanese [Kaiparowitsia implicata GSE-PSE-MK54-09C]|jgi:rhodanese-related sulfurtransferase|nr:rhodanese [Kaiparowitsia implicata GSE-PSE-MK54-09C]